MDYGYQLLRHVVQQVFGNIGQAARLTLLLSLVAPVFLYLTNPQVFAAVYTGAEIDPGTMPQVSFGALFLAIVLGIIAWCWAAVGWHRYVLLEEPAMGILPRWIGSRVFAYLGRVIVVGLVLVLALFGAGFVVGLIVTIAPLPLVGGLLGLGLVIFASWLFVRIGLVLPAAALGEPLRIGESWAETRPVSGAIVLPIIVIGVVAAIANGLVGLVFGVTVIGLALSAAVSWLQLLLNLALMTTLYGNRIEGRQLN